MVVNFLIICLNHFCYIKTKLHTCNMWPIKQTHEHWPNIEGSTFSFTHTNGLFRRCWWGNNDDVHSILLWSSNSALCSLKRFLTSLLIHLFYVKLTMQLLQYAASHILILLLIKSYAYTMFILLVWTDLMESIVMLIILHYLLYTVETQHSIFPLGNSYANYTFKNIAARRTLTLQAEVSFLLLLVSLRTSLRFWAF